MRFKASALALAVLMAVPLASACSAGHNESIIIAGSTSVQPYVEIVAEEYENHHKDYEIVIQGGGSSAGITAVESGTAQIGMSSRSLKAEERHLWSVEVAKDGLAVIVHPDNPINDITLEQIRKIYTAECKNWGELGGIDARIHIITREEGSGTRSAFEELVMGGLRINNRSIVQDSNGAVRQLVSDDKNSIGFISLGLVGIGEKPVKPLRLEGADATRENVVNGSYSLYRPFLFVMKEAPEGPAKQFINYIISEEGQRMLSDEGLIPE